jgi:predicted RNA-binding Zn-ribbon protein involved in translation (DUF1610 family)
MAKKTPENGSEKLVLVCPKCKSIDVGLDKISSAQMAMGFATKYVCNKCGYLGYLFPEVPISKLGKI